MSYEYQLWSVVSKIIRINLLLYLINVKFFCTFTDSYLSYVPQTILQAVSATSFVCSYEHFGLDVTNLDQRRVASICRCLCLISAYTDSHCIARWTFFKIFSKVSSYVPDIAEQQILRVTRIFVHELNFPDLLTSNFDNSRRIAIIVLFNVFQLIQETTKQFW